MKSSIPDSISTDELLRLQVNAEPDFVPAETPAMQKASDAEKVAYVVDKIEELTDEFGTVFSYKLIADYCIYKLFEHHNEAYEGYVQAGNTQTALCWARDAGHFQVIGTTLRNILCGPDDFIAPTEDEEFGGETAA
tara:strand:+ start:214 stop:621 length:408 start_codon:yes stop_codon:yes gene_type:complete